MAQKLGKITTSYHTFEENQILTAKQLNEFLEYFDDQDRLSRISLSGVGVVCGFETSATKKGTLVLTQGAAVTTDGDLIHLREKGTLSKLIKPSQEYTYYRDFKDDRAKYKHFIKNGVQIPLYELIPTGSTINSATDFPLASIPNADKLVVLLYLECYEDEPNLCDGVSCDNQGIQQVQNLHVLLVAQEDADYILSNDEIYDKFELMSTYLQMQDLSVKRVILNNVNTERADKLRESYQISNEAQLLTDLKSGLTLMDKKITPYFTDHPIQSILKALDQKLPASVTNQPLYFQYRYDLLKDVVDSYNEAKEQFIEVATECCPSITAFPKHILLGKWFPNELDGQISNYRHKFYKSPILVDKSRRFEPFIWTLFRMLHQLNAYPNLPETSSGGLFRTEVKITPSRFSGPLHTKAIPFYYNPSLTILRAWDRDKTLKGKYRNHYSYNTGFLNPAGMFQTPLKYNLEAADFYTIEGHQGRDYVEVMSKIDQIKKENGLAFDVKALSIDLDANYQIDPSKYECEFEDLSVLLNAWVKEQECTIGKVISLVSAFSVKEPGKNIKDAQYTPRTISRDNAIAEPVLMAKAVAAPTSGTTTTTSGSTSTSLTGEQREAIRNNELEYGRTNVVLETLTPTVFTVGNSYLQAVLTNPKGTAADLIAGATLHANDVVLTEQVEWVPEQYNALVKNSIQIMAYSHVLSNSIPLNVAGITDEIIAKYNTNINNLCTVLSQIQVSQANVSSLSVNNRTILTLLINQLSNICCASKQLQTLLAEIDKRKDTILARLTLIKFIEQHPGLEHTRGVQPGGTFVLVYLRKGATMTTSATISSTPQIVSSGTTSVSTINPKTDLTSATAEVSVADTKTKSASIEETFTLADSTSTKKILSKSGKIAVSTNQSPIELLNSGTRVATQDLLSATLAAASANDLFTAANGTVIADFSLPYMCCSDCAPINFIMPAPVVRLSLPTNILCLGKETSYSMNFKVEPTNGIIKPDKEIPGLTISGTKLTIDTLLFPSSSLDQPINFTVNDQLTDCKLTVVKPLTALISAPANPVTTPVVPFSALGNFPKGTLYEWDFGDGGTSTLRNVTHTYTLPVNETNTVTVTLKVTPANGACPTIVTHDLVFEEVAISLEKYDFCFSDTQAYPFTVTPEGATADISGPGVDTTNNTFNPSNSIVGEFPIYLNGSEVFNVIVKPDPVVVFSGGFIDVGFRLLGSVDYADAYKWLFLDAQGNEFYPSISDSLGVLIPLDVFNNLPSGSEFTVQLIGTNGCADKKFEKTYFAPVNSKECNADALNDVKGMFTAFGELLRDPEYKTLSDTQKAAISDVGLLIQKVIESPDLFFSGAQNNYVLETMSIMLPRFVAMLKETQPDSQQRRLLLDAYRMLLAIFFAIIQCQNEADLERFTPIFDQISENLDGTKGESLPAAGITVDADGRLKSYTEAVLAYRPDRSPSNVYLSSYINFLLANR